MSSNRKLIVISESLWRALKRKAFEKEKSMKWIVEDAIVMWLLVDECGPELDLECVKRMMLERGGRVVWMYQKLTGRELDFREVEDGQEE